MNRKKPKSYFAIFALLLLLISVPKNQTETFRGSTVAFFAPFWEMLLTIPVFETESQNIKFQKLKLENQQLLNEIDYLKQLILQEQKINRQLGALESKEFRKLTKKHQKQLQDTIKSQLQAIPAQVIYRPSGSWNSSFWINVGEAQGPTIAKNSPVIYGNAIVGVIDYVGKNQSRVRLITDSRLSPSVRAIRGNIQDAFFLENFQKLMDEMRFVDEQLLSNSDKEQLLKKAVLLKQRYEKKNGEINQHLAKGEVHGSSQPLWRSMDNRLYGIGFNYDFPDEEGPARDLRTGLPVSKMAGSDAVPLIQLNDILVTTGLDGVFPAGFLVGKVSKIHSLKEGDYYYELEAKTSAGDLDKLTVVFVIPPIGFDEALSL